MSALNKVIHDRRDAGISLQPLLRGDQWGFACRTCRKMHRETPANDVHAMQLFRDFAFKHPEEQGCVVAMFTPQEVERLMRREERRRNVATGLRKSGWSHNADVKEAFQGSDQSIDLTSFNSLASSATAGWSSHWIDNSSNLYSDYVLYMKIAAVNTAPANNKAFYLWAATSLNTTDLPCTGASSGNTVANSSTTSAALTFPTVATPLPSLFGAPIKTIQYPVQNIANTTPNISVARTVKIGLYLWFPLLNYSGMTMAGSGNAFKYRGVYNTVV